MPFYDNYSSKHVKYSVNNDANEIILLNTNVKFGVCQTQWKQKKYIKFGGEIICKVQ